VIVVFVHQNFPGQYKHLARHFATQPGSRVLFVTQSASGEIPSVEKIVYDPGAPQTLSCHPYTVEFDRSIRAGLAVAEVLRRMKTEGLRPDVICGHNGWGEMLFVKDVFPDVPVLSYFEFYYHALGVDVGFDPEFSGDAIDPLRLRTRNAVNLLGFDAADWGNTPTQWQRSVHPPELRSRLTVIHEGVDTEAICPDPTAWLHLQRDGVVLNRQSEIVTYVARNLEPYRGFHVFMRAAARVLKRRPQARVVVVGGDEISYGLPLPDGGSYRELMIRELGADLDIGRVHFLGRVPFDTFLKLLQVSSAHVYLTYPFVLSWSFIEALSVGCAIVGSATPPVQEVVRHGENGLLVDFFSVAAVADAIEELLDRRDLAAELGEVARRTAMARYDLHSRQLPLWDALIGDLVAGRRPALLPG